MQWIIISDGSIWPIKNSRSVIYRLLETFFLFDYRVISSSNASCFKADPGIYRLIMEGIFDAYVLRPFEKKLIL